MDRWQFCPPAKAGAASGALVGLVIWALVAYVPAFRDGVPQPLADALPFVLGWTGHTLATWAARHEAPGPAAAPQAPRITLPPPAAGTGGIPPTP